MPISDNPFELLPNELTARILSYLKPREQSSAALVCRSWHTIMNSHDFARKSVLKNGKDKQIQSIENCYLNRKKSTAYALVALPILLGVLYGLVFGTIRLDAADNTINKLVVVIAHIWMGLFASCIATTFGGALIAIGAEKYLDHCCKSKIKDLPMLLHEIDVGANTNISLLKKMQ